MSYTHNFLQREARSFFGCPELQGVELENQGGSGSALSHWEQRILEVQSSPCMHYTLHATDDDDCIYSCQNIWLYSKFLASEVQW